MTTMPESPAAASPYQWKFRPLFIFAASATDPSLIQQRRVLAAHRAGLRDRQVPAIWVIGGAVSVDGGPRANHSADALRSRFGVSPGEFKVVLVGKDGGVKLVSRSAIGPENLYATIDAMPMRREEMRHR